MSGHGQQEKPELAASAAGHRGAVTVAPLLGVALVPARDWPGCAGDGDGVAECETADRTGE